MKLTTRIENNNSSKLFVNILIFVATWFVYFQSIPLLTPFGTEIIIVMGLLALLISSSKRFIIDSYSFSWLIVFLIMLLSVTFSINRGMTLKNIIRVFAYYSLAVFITEEQTRINYFIKCLKGFSLVCITITIIQFVFPTLYYATIGQIISSSGAYNYSIFQRVGVTNGLFVQTAMNAFFLSIGFILYSNLFFYKKKGMAYGILALLFMAGIFMTGKRSFFIISIILLIIQLYTNYKKDSKRGKLVKYAFYISVFFAIIYLLPTYIPSLSYSYNRVFSFLENRDIGNRLNLYDEAVSAIKSNPIGVGYGAYFSYSATGDGAHNSYLQIIAELGWLFGVVFFIPSLCYLTRNIRSIFGFFQIYRQEEEYYMLLTCLMFQIMFLVYALSGNPYDTPVFLFLLFAFQRISVKVSLHYEIME